MAISLEYPGSAEFSLYQNWPKPFFVRRVWLNRSNPTRLSSVEISVVFSVMLFSFSTHDTIQHYLTLFNTEKKFVCPFLAFINGIFNFFWLTCWIQVYKFMKCIYENSVLGNQFKKCNFREAKINGFFNKMRLWRIFFSKNVDFILKRNCLTNRTQFFWHYFSNFRAQCSS